MELSILIVNWNTRDLLAQCLESVYAYPPNVGFEVIVVDNNSSDGSASMVREKFPHITLLENDANVGFAKANNQAIAQSHGGHKLLLNPDTLVQPDALTVLVSFMRENPTVGAAGSLLLNSDGTLQTSCFPAPTLFRELWGLFHFDKLIPLANYRMNDWPHDKPRPVDTIRGACMIIRGDVLDRIGALDEDYFMYSEEVDLCLRLRRKGWQIYWVPQARIIHFGGQSTQQAAVRMFIQLYRGKLQYFRKNYGRAYAVAFKIILIFASLARLLMSPLSILSSSTQRSRSLWLAKGYSRLLLQLPRM